MWSRTTSGAVLDEPEVHLTGTIEILGRGTTGSKAGIVQLVKLREAVVWALDP